MGQFSVFHWVVVLLIVILIFGPSKLPQLGASLGAGIKNFRKSLKDGNPEEDKTDKDLPPEK